MHNTPVGILAGGNWDMKCFKHGRLIIGHLRVPLNIAEAIQKGSGKRAIVTCILPDKKTQKQPVTWISKNEDVRGEAYLRYFQELSAAKGKPLALRQGESADIGMVAASADDIPCPVRPKTYCLRGARRHWMQTETELFLAQELWTQLETVGRIEDDQGFVVKPQNGSSKENLHWPRRPKAVGTFRMRTNVTSLSLLTKGLTPQKLTVTENGLLDLKTAGLTRAPKHRWLKLRFLLPFSMFTVHKIPNPQMKKGAVAATKRPKQGLQQGQPEDIIMAQDSCVEDSRQMAQVTAPFAAWLTTTRDAKGQTSLLCVSFSRTNTICLLRPKD